MSTETAAAPLAPENLLAQMQENTDKLYVAAEVILQRLALQPDPKAYGVEHIDPADAVILRMTGVDASSRREIDRVVARVRKELEYREVYTSEDAFEAAEKEYLEASHAENEKREEVERKIAEFAAELRRPLTALEQRREKAEQVYHPMRDAREQLAQHAPPFIVSRAKLAEQPAGAVAAHDSVRSVERELYAFSEMARRYDEHRGDPLFKDARPLSAAELQRKAELEAKLPRLREQRQKAVAVAKDAIANWVQLGLESVALTS